MTSGGIIVIGSLGACLALVCYGLWFDARRWLDNRDRRRHIAECMNREARRRWQDSDQRARVAQILATRDWELEQAWLLPEFTERND